MRKVLLAILAAAALLSCKAQEPKVMVRHVPERADDFIFENDLVCSRIYGKALEGNPTSPGVDIWVKLPGKLVANEWYSHIGEQGSEGYYHHDHGGKDCYKVSTSLGGGASAPYIDGKIRYPATNYRSFDILESAPDRAVFVLHYPEWDVDGVSVALDKKITVTPGTYFFKCEDTWTFSGADSLTVAAGINRHVKQETIEEEFTGSDLYAIWEKASDQHAEPEDGRIGVAVVMPSADSVAVTRKGTHGLCIKTVASGETVIYWFGSCWSKGNIKDSKTWFDYVKDNNTR